MTDKQKVRLITRWDALTQDGKTRLLDYLDYCVEREQPHHQDVENARLESFRVQMAKVQDLKARIESAQKEVRQALMAASPARGARDLQSTLEILCFLSFAAEYKPFYLYEESGAALHLAEKMIRDVPRQLAHFEKSKP
jgi:hypothetical protein